MISVSKVARYCKDDISKIENYEAAIADTTQIWDCHHRLELTLDGDFAHTREDLKRMNMYYNRPYFELIFLTKSEHRRLHRLGTSDETKTKLSAAKKGENNPMYGKTRIFSDAAKSKMSAARKGKKFSNEHRAKIRAARKGKHWKIVDNKRVWY